MHIPFLIDDQIQQTRPDLGGWEGYMCGLTFMFQGGEATMSSRRA